ncbi:unnamed protein product [Adineta steineri]|uniref:Uncharacterized protein n=1 Tax=Adineta steineri TaxID=433720 RepID=A0A815S0D8_9BILA|nr:unnamed protein product [Adineta steineri]CAF4024231.1 unnamed protein product [Adineta steineri]
MSDCPRPSRIKCSWCHINAVGRCDHCRSRFNVGCFQQHVQSCPGVRHVSRATLRLVPECQFCNNDADGKCSGCNESVCRACFDRSHRVHTVYRTESNSSACIIS